MRLLSQLEKRMIKMSGLLFLMKACGLAFMDVGIKTYIESKFHKGETKNILNGKIQIRRVHNKGMAFNVLDHEPELVKTISCGVTGILTLYYLYVLSKRGSFIKKVGLTLLVGGAWSNNFDRIFRGYVVDYIGFNSKWDKLNNLTFNLADFAILIGTDLTTIGELVDSRKRVEEVE